MRRTDLSDSTCPVARTLDIVGDFWSLLIVRDAFFGKKRFGEFQKSLGVAKNILAARLRLLVEQGIFSVVPAADGSAYQDYVLTEKGEALGPVVKALRLYGEQHCPAPKSAAAKSAMPKRRVKRSSAHSG